MAIFYSYNRLPEGNKITLERSFACYFPKAAPAAGRISVLVSCVLQFYNIIHTYSQVVDDHVICKNICSTLKSPYCGLVWKVGRGSYFSMADAIIFMSFILKSRPSIHFIYHLASYNILLFKIAQSKFSGCTHWKYGDFPVRFLYVYHGLCWQCICLHLWCDLPALKV